MANEQLDRLEDKVKEILTKSKFDVIELTTVWTNIGFWIHSKVTDREAELLNAKNKLPKKEETK